MILGKGRKSIMRIPALLALASFLALPVSAPVWAAGAGAHDAPAQEHGKAEGAKEKTKDKAAAAEEKKKKRKNHLLPPRLPAEIRKDYQRYCYNIADQARDARYLRQKRKIEQMERRLVELTERLERKRAEFEAWVKKREAITRRVTASMLKVYEKMEPDAAAQQIRHMEYAVAVALLTGMKPEKASAILMEMDPKIAGRLVNVIVGRVAESAVGQPGRAFTGSGGGQAAAGGTN